MHLNKKKCIVVTGGVISGLGKGLFISSLGKLLQAKGYSVVPIKIDPYLNVDAGTMNPIEHGEVFVLDDGTEADMDLGNYERFMDLILGNKSNITTGKIYKEVIEKERRGDYLGKTVQIIPHITGELKNHYKELFKQSKADFVLIEIGGTVGDIENQIFLESVRELALEEEVFFVHCALIPIIGVVGEQKTKPIQQSVRLLREIGIVPNMLFCRAKDYLEDKIKEKISLFCGVKKEMVISGPDLKNIYEIPLMLDNQKVAEKCLDYFGLKPIKNDLILWEDFVNKRNNADKKIKIAITGKYTSLKDSYVSIKEALEHCAGFFGVNIEIKFIETTLIEEGKLDVDEIFSDVNGIIVPGGFGSRGTEGKIQCIKYAREKNIPFLGLCFGFQLAVIEFARNVCEMKEANTTEIDSKTPYPVIDILEEQKKISKLGGTMRLGAYEAVLVDNSLVKSLYNSKSVSERHRHRFEVNNKFIKKIEENGLIFSGKSADGQLMEFLEISGKKFFVATQAHPEFKSRPLNPHPLFLGLIQECMESKKLFKS